MNDDQKKKVRYIAIIVVVGVVLALIITLVATSLKRLDSFEVGLSYDTVARKLAESVDTEGLHSGPPGFEFIKFPSVFESIEFQSLQCLNKDGIPILLDLTYQYRVNASDLYTVVSEFKDKDTFVEVLHHAGQAAVMESCSLFNTTQFQAMRGTFQSDVGSKLSDRYSNLHTEVSEIQVNNIARPIDYESAVRAKETAREDITVAENERPRLLIKATKVKDQAEANAAITVAQAESQARIILERAQRDAEGILDGYEREAGVYANLMGVNGLYHSVEGFLSYLGIRAISEANNPVYVGMTGPAITSYVTP